MKQSLESGSIQLISDFLFERWFLLHRSSQNDKLNDYEQTPQRFNSYQPLHIIV